jgi:hypothetical protein
MKISLLIPFIFLFCFDGINQTYTISTGGTVNTCSGTVYDSGGSGSNYAASENYTMTFCSSSSNCLRITLSRDFGGDGGDKIILYDGPTTAYAVIDNIDGNQSFTNGTQYTSTSGCITLKFKSDSDGTVGTGFSAVISCVACAATPSYNNPNGFIYTCSANFYDWKGPSTNYISNLNKTTKFCSSNGTCIRATFSSFSTESGFDYLRIYDGNSTSAALIGTYSGNTSPGTVTSSTGCLTFNFTSDGSNVASGWAASITCVDCATPPPPEAQNCDGGRTICTTSTVDGNSSGSGSISDLNSTNDGCLYGENQSSWYYFSPSTSGTIALTIDPQSNTDDYDFAIWGPMSTVTCPPNAAPLRCSYSAAQDQTGLRSAASDVTEGPTGDSWVSPITVVADQVYLMVIDNYSETTQPYTLSWTLSNGATLDCTPLPVEFGHFSGKNCGYFNLLEWNTTSENNTDDFYIQRSSDGYNWELISNVDAQGNSTEEIIYHYQDFNLIKGNTNYYKLIQTDIDGKRNELGIISIDNSISAKNFILKRLNLIGQEVNDNYSGFVILQYSDNTIEMIFQSLRE